MSAKLTPPYTTIPEMLAHEERMMGRPVRLVNAATVVSKRPELPQQITMVVYDASREDPELGLLPQLRWGIFVDGVPQGGGLA